MTATAGMSCHYHDVVDVIGKDMVEEYGYPLAQSQQTIKCTTPSVAEATQIFKYVHSCSYRGCSQTASQSQAYVHPRYDIPAVNPKPGLYLEAWRLELATDPDREFSLN